MLLLALAGAATYMFLNHIMSEQMDAHLEEVSQAIQRTLRAGARGMAVDSEAMADVIDDFHYRNMKLTIVDAPTGRLVAVAEGNEWARGPWQVAVDSFTLGGQPLILTLSQSLRSQTIVLKELRDAYIIALPLIMILGYAGGVALAGRSLAPAVQAFERQRRFMADASHELRTPVAIVSGESELMLSRSDRPAEDYRDSMQTIRSEARRMSRVVDDLFLLARIDSGEPVVMPAELYLNDLVHDCVRAIRSLARERGVKVQLMSDPELDISMRGDEALLRRAIINLLDNAVKYTAPGGEVVVNVAGEGTGCTVRVTDTGSGIPADLHERVFERFFRGDHSQLKSSMGGGAGLGLSIARSIARAHSGSLHIERSGPKGTTVLMWLPARGMDRPH